VEITIMPTALFSVSDKRLLVGKLAKPLAEIGWDFLASGGTARHLKEAGIPVEEVADYTGYAEILGGRVKTLHPAVHGGLLARQTEADMSDLLRINARMIDLVAVNLYPFQQTVTNQGVTLAQAIENIDIGGVALIRAAAKNYSRVTVLTAPEDYAGVSQELIENGEVSDATRQRLAEKAFAHTAAYDSAITAYLSGSKEETLQLHALQSLRYGENPHQSATLYGYEPNIGPMGGELLQGKPLSYNNLLDLDAAWRAVLSFERPTVCIVKHLSSCGLASADSLASAYIPALASDPVSAFGSVIAVNRPFDGEIAELVVDLFMECVAAPGFTPEALEVLATKENLRLLSMPHTGKDSRPELRSIYNGILQQDVDLGDPPGAEWKVVSSRRPTDEEMASLKFAWKTCQHVKSNAIVFARGEATVGIGGGQPNRVDCVHIAAQRAGEKSRGAVMASDAFFPFPDAVEAAAGYGITAVVQPGGSLRDRLSIDAADTHDLVMVMTGVRHFRH
jgi:phosphoribosylaminoimidazolecarboxamide formyltransferase/IMP cyclohydrolase